jgi:hypothetical protein
MRYISLLFLILPWALLSQQPQASISKKVAEVGDRVDLVYRIELNQKDKFNFNPHSGIFPAKLTSENSSLTTSNFNEIEITLFEDSMINKGDKKIWMGVYELTPWDSGLVVLQGQRFTINDSTYDFPSVYLECKLVPHKKGQEIYDIKESFAKTPERKSWIIFFLKYIAWCLLPLIGYLIYRWVVSRKNKPIERPQMEISLKAKTLLAIDALEKAEMWRKDQLKEHFVELSYILRSYLTARYELSLLDKTTNETRLLLTQVGLRKDIVETILRLLSHSDMVKFAASEPAEELIQKSLFLLRQTVVETSPIEFEYVG